MLLSNAIFLLSFLFVNLGSSQPVKVDKRHFKIALQKSYTPQLGNTTDHQQVVSFLASKQRQKAYNHGSGNLK
jgi:hypothetical protein